ncbi:MAG: imidazole glycerol phosphate synthase subunit HisH, partial [Deltaproteobacteria bacterium]|nr:imidazole glycerol phosphate synthase subunit HisH [Deltaproteobacteria bacterium]
GLSVLKGIVKRFKTRKVPQIGWNLAVVSSDSELARNLTDSYFYFVHSYYVEPYEDITLFKTDYFGEFVSGIQKGNIVAVQFHPEKSSGAGLNFLRKWVEIC